MITIDKGKKTITTSARLSPISHSDLPTSHAQSLPGPVP